MNRPVAEFKTINPATEEIINQYQIMTEKQINDTVKKARITFQDWKRDIDKRTDFLYAFAKELRKNKEHLAKTATQEMGKAIKEAQIRGRKMCLDNRILCRSRENLFN